jgi:hypothetical protein
MMDADIGDAGLRRVAMHMRQRGSDAVKERLAADEAMIGQHVGTLRHMLAAAEADFEMQRARLAEEALGGDRPFRRHSDLGQQVFHQRLLKCAQGLALGAAIEAVESGRIAGFMRSHGEGA